MKGLEIMSIFGSPKGDSEEGSSEKDMACKALWKSIKRDDYDTFKEALAEYMSYSKDSSKEDSEDEDDYEEEKPKKKSIFG